MEYCRDSMVSGGREGGREGWWEGGRDGRTVNAVLWMF